MQNNQILLLEKEIMYHKKLYYSGQEIISDAEYDKLEEQLRKLDPDNNVLKVVGSSFFNNEKIKHSTKMLSLNKVYEFNELIKWSKNFELVGNFKIDGSSASLVYKDNKLSIAKTRGDGVYGENILNKCLYITDIVKTLSFNCEIRGEIFCTFSNFEKLKKEMKKRGLSEPSSPRNIVAGILARKEHSDLAQFLSFKAFDVLDSSMEFKSEYDKNIFLTHYFDTPPFKLLKNKEDIKQYLKLIKEFQQKGDFLIDGAVFAINNLKEQKNQGETSHHPKYKMAFKFESEFAITKLKKIDWQISRFGVYTPVGIIESTNLQDAIITKVTLHNLKTIRMFNLKKGDVIKIIRSGEVIPKFIETIEESQNNLLIPKKCEYCHSQLQEDDVRLFCNNQSCSGRQFYYFLNFVKKIGIEDLSESRLREVIKTFKINTPIDLYKLKEKDFLLLKNTKDKMANKLYHNIQKSKKVELTQFFNALNFKSGAKKSTELLLKSGYNTLEDFLNLKIENIINIKGFGDKKANDYVNSIQQNKKLIQEFLNIGFNISIPERKDNKKMLHISFCITGSLEKASRKDYQDIIINNGGVYNSSVSKNTDYLITNSTDESSKLIKAKKLNIPIISENDFIEIFNLKDQIN